MCSYSNMYNQSPMYSYCLLSEKIEMVEKLHPEGDPEKKEENHKHIECMAKKLQCPISAQDPKFMEAHNACVASGFPFYAKPE